MRTVPHHQPRSKRILRSIARYAAIALVCYGLYWLALGRFYPSAPAASYPPANDRAEAQRQDLDYLRALPALDRSFSDAAAEAFERGRQTLLAKADTLSTAQFALGVSELVALAGNGHTNVSPGRRAGLMNRIPLRLFWFSDGLFVIHTDRANASLRGARVEAIGTRRPEDMLADLARFRGGRPEYARARSMLLMESPDALAAVYPEMDTRHLPLSLLLTDGTRRDVVVAALDADPKAPNPNPSRYLSPLAAAEIAGDGMPALDPLTPLPASLRGHAASVYHEVIDSDTLYVHLWSMADDKAGALSGQLDQLLSSRASPWRAAIVDLRFNGGGDYTKVHAFARDLPTHVADDGQVIVLVNNETFSAALVAAAWLKHYGGARTVTMGEALGDAPGFWAEGGTLTLPNSGMAISFATGYHDWEHGCSDVYRCFSLNFWYGVAAGKLDPDSETGWRFSDYLQGRDSVLDAALARVRVSPSVQ